MRVRRKLAITIVIAMALVMMSAGSAFAADKGPYDTSLIPSAGQVGISLNMLWVVIGAVLVIFMQAGFALVETGFCRAKHAAHVVSTNFAIFGLGFVAYFLIGFPIMFSGFSFPGVFGLDKPISGDALIKFGDSGHWVFLWAKGGFALSDLGGAANGAAIAAFFLYMVAFMDTTATIPTGAMAERWKWKAFVGWGLFCGALYYPIFGGWTWGGGWLSQLGNSMHLGFGYVDFAGSGVVHAMGGVAGLAGALVLGPRIGKYGADGKPRTLAGHNIPMALLGTFILLFGWFGFNAASTFAATDVRFAVVATNTAHRGRVRCRGRDVLLHEHPRMGKKPDPGMMANGMLAGLVAITAPCAFVAALGRRGDRLIAGIIVVESVFFFERTGSMTRSARSRCTVSAGSSVSCASGSSPTVDYGAGWNVTTEGAAATASGVTGILYDFDLGIRSARIAGDRLARDLHRDVRHRLRVLQDPERADQGWHPADGGGREAGMDLAEMGVLAYDNLTINELDVVGPVGDPRGRGLRRSVAGSDHGEVRVPGTAQDEESRRAGRQRRRPALRRSPQGLPAGRRPASSPPARRRVRGTYRGVVRPTRP